MAINSEFSWWQESFDSLPLGADEDDIAGAETANLEAAHRLMRRCRDKPPGYEVQFSPQEINALYPGDLFPYFEKLALNESLRFARVSKELALRLESDHPKRALELLTSALFPESSANAFANHDAYNRWWTELEKEADALEDNIRGAVAKRDFSVQARAELINWTLALALCHGLFQAAYTISENQDKWNFWITAHMARIQEMMGHSGETAKLKDRCLEILSASVDDTLWASVIDRAMDRAVIRGPANAPATSRAGEEVQVAIIRMLDAKLEPLLKSVGDNIRISHAIHDRLDLVIEKLIDLDQRSDLTWQQIQASARGQPDYVQLRRDNEASMANLLGETWRILLPDSREDLVDAEFVFAQCTQWGSGWRMAIMGYCTVAERELQASYWAAQQQLFGVKRKGSSPVETFGDLIRLFRNLQTRVGRTKAIAELQTLFDLLEDLGQMNGIRIRATHPKENKVNQRDATKIRESLICTRPFLLASIVAVRSRHNV